MLGVGVMLMIVYTYIFTYSTTNNLVYHDDTPIRDDELDGAATEHSINSLDPPPPREKERARSLSDSDQTNVKLRTKSRSGVGMGSELP